jgi:hypothetical protein
MKPDLLNECNDQRIPPNEFKDVFCKRCRNQNCVNAGWSSSSFEERVRTQVDRLLVHPHQARPEDTRFDHLRAMHFVEVAAAIAIARSSDPWAGPGVHLAEPSPDTQTSAVVENAVAKLAEARGKRPTPTMVSVEEEKPIEPIPVVLPEVTKPVDPPREAVPPKPIEAPRPVSPPRPLVNTEFPEEGLMIGGAASSPTPPPADPWAPKPKVNVVPKGARIKME